MNKYTPMYLLWFVELSLSSAVTVTLFQINSRIGLWGVGGSPEQLEKTEIPPP
jgi:hypothetical protein